MVSIVYGIVHLLTSDEMSSSNNKGQRYPSHSHGKRGGDEAEEEDDLNNCYYEYHHGSGRHILVRNNANGMEDLNRPKYSSHCICCNCVDFLIFAGCIAFLFFAIRYALYCLENADGGD